jgi:ATP-binding cassette subfamily A (ABC1) protein 3
MDTYARRHLWEMLKEYRTKKERLIILTTHFMDEAEFLGNRIGIMGDGKLLTLGKSLFLKEKFGAGYDLTIVKESSSVDTKKITDKILGSIEGAKLTGDISMEIKYNLP